MYSSQNFTLPSMGRPPFDFLFGFVAQRIIDKRNFLQDFNQNMGVLPFFSNLAEPTPYRFLLAISAAKSAKGLAVAPFSGEDLSSSKSF